MNLIRLSLALLLLYFGLASSDTLSQSIDSKKVMLSLNRWASAWSQQDIDRYIDAYAGNFRGLKNSRREWLNQRRNRILSARSIDVKLSDIQLRSMSEDKAIVDFVQRFRSNRFSDRVKKRLTFRRIGKQWKIISERTLMRL